MRAPLLTLLLLLGLAFGQLDLSTPGGASVLATFVTDPPNAEVYVAGTFIGTGSATARINMNTPTPYTVRVPGGDYEVFSGSVTLIKAGVTEVYVPRVTPQTDMPRSLTAPERGSSTSTPVTPTGADNVELLLQLAACADLSDRLERLTCYDRLAGEYGLSGYVSPTFALPTALGSGTAARESAEPTSLRDTPARSTSTDTLVRALPPQASQTQDASEVELVPTPTLPRASLFDVARDGSYEEVYAVIGAGENVNAADVYGQTVLMYAAAGNQDPNVHATLVARGAEVDARSLARWTALMYAARDNPNPEVVLRLLELGADPQLVNGDGQTALDLARGNPALQDTDVLNRLEVLTRVAPPPEPVAVPRDAPSSPPPAPVSQSCCKYCRKGYACGNSCIARNKTCHVGVGCACNAGVGTDDGLIAAEEQFFVGLESDFEEPFVAGVCGEELQLSLVLP